MATAGRGSGDDLIESLVVRPGMTVLDPGCGDGTTALPTARRGAGVLGVNIADILVAAGNSRAAAAGLDKLRFEQGDAANLDGIASDSFDLVVSIFRSDVCPAPIRCRSGPGAGHPARRAHRHWKLDSGRSDPDRTGVEDQRGLYTGPARWLRQPIGLGHRGQPTLSALQSADPCPSLRDTVIRSG